MYVYQYFDYLISITKMEEIEKEYLRHMLRQIDFTILMIIQQH
jgi:hypothetical protein